MPIKKKSRVPRCLLLENLEDRRLLTCNQVVLDAGHGGSVEVGGSSPNNATSVSGILEKDLTLQLANSLQPLLEARGFDVTMTRTTDTNLGLADRAAVASGLIDEDTDHIFFLSIHFNGFSDASARGTETLIDSTSNINADQDTTFATAIQSAALAPWLPEGGRDRGVRSQSLGVLRDSRLGNNADSHPVVAALLEAEFITNVDVDAVLTGQPTFIGQMAASIADGFVEARRELCKPTDVAFVIDTTSSMSDDIDAVKDRASDIVEQLFENAPDSRVGIVVYRDHGDAFVSSTQLAFTDDRDEILSSISAITIAGGGDFPEAVYSGLMHAIRVEGGLGEWRQEEPVRKVIVQMGDAPAHDPEPVTGLTLSQVTAAAMAGGIEMGEPEPEAEPSPIASSDFETPESPESPESPVVAGVGGMTNPVMPLDVNADGVFSLEDVRDTLNAILLYGGATELTPDAKIYPDTSGDGVLTPSDLRLPLYALLGDGAGPTVTWEVIPGDSDIVIGNVHDANGVQTLSVHLSNGERVEVPLADGSFAFDSGMLMGVSSVDGIQISAEDYLGNIAEYTLSSETESIPIDVVAEDVEGFSLSLSELMAEGEHDGAVSPITIYSILVGGDPSAEESFSNIAEQNGGEVFRASTADDVVDAVLTALDAATGSGSAPVIESLESSAMIVGDTNIGDSVSIVGAFTDGDLTGDYHVSVDWGDGEVSDGLFELAGGVGSFEAEHSYDSGGVFEISVIVSDGDSDSEAAQTAAYVTGYRMDGGELSVVGTRSHDFIKILPGAGNHVWVHTNLVEPGLQYVDTTGIESVMALLGDGNDLLSVFQHASIPFHVDAGAGNDVIRTGAADDMVAGGGGNDIILTFGGEDQIDGGAGWDFVWAGAQHDVVNGGEGHDRIFGQNGDDMLLGGPGLDSLFGGKGDDQLLGGEDSDRLFGQRGDDFLDGEEGMDYGFGGKGIDTIFAEYSFD